jgi:hypothetical protein
LYSAGFYQRETNRKLKLDQCIPVGLKLVARTIARTMQIINKPIEMIIIIIVNHFELRQEVPFAFLCCAKTNKQKYFGQYLFYPFSLCFSVLVLLSIGDAD